MPTEGVQWQARKYQLSGEEIAIVAGEMARQGLTHIRLTGGELLVRPDIVEIVKRLAAIPYIQEVSLTTNAMLLEKLAKPLSDAGL